MFCADVRVKQMYRIQLPVGIKTEYIGYVYSTPLVFLVVILLSLPKRLCDRPHLSVCLEMLITVWLVYDQSQGDHTYCITQPCIITAFI